MSCWGCWSGSGVGAVAWGRCPTAGQSGTPVRDISITTPKVLTWEKNVRLVLGGGHSPESCGAPGQRSAGLSLLVFTQGPHGTWGQVVLLHLGGGMDARAPLRAGV